MMPMVNTAELKPNKMFIMADATRPTVRNARELERSARKPFPNFETPYNSPCIVRNMPRCALSMPSFSMYGIAILRFLRTK